MPLLPQAGPSLDIDPALLERAKLALQSLKFEEQAARYRAAYSALLEAIAEAEAGNEAPLRQWLDERSLHLGSSSVSSEPVGRKPLGSEPVTPAPHFAGSPNFSGAPNLAESPSEARENPAPMAAVASPWDLMHRSALERAIFWTVPSAIAEVTLEQPLDTHFALPDLLLPANQERQRKPWWAIPHVYVSLIVHALLLVLFSVWIITSVQNPLALSIVAGTVESDVVLADTPMEMPATLEQSPDVSPSLPSIDPISVPVDLPSIAAADLGVGPRVSTILASSSANQNALAAGTGTKFVEGAEFFGSKAVGNTFVFVVDCSPSMLRDGAFEVAKTEILKSLSLLKPKQRYFVSFFGKEIIPMQFRGSAPESFAVRASPENLEKTVDWIGRVTIQKDGRPPIDALGEAIAMQPDAIFLLFDGDTKVDRWTTKIQERNRVDGFLSDDTPKVPIHVVHFFREEFEREMRTLAEENGGTYRFIARPQKPFRGPK